MSTPGGVPVRGPKAPPRRLLTDWTTTAGVAGDGLAALVAAHDAVAEAIHLATLGYEVFVLDGTTPDAAAPPPVHVVDVAAAALPDAWHGRFALVVADPASAPSVVPCVADAGLLVVLGDAPVPAGLAPGLVEVTVEVGPDPDAPAVERFRAVHARL
jgi:hypothetical protein